MPKLHFRSISWEQNDRFSPNFIYVVIMVILSRSSLALLHVIFAHLYKSYGPWFTPKFHFRSISWEQYDRFSPNFIYAVIMVILSRSSLALLHVIFEHLYQSYGPSFTPKFHFRSISWEQNDRFLPNCIYALILTRSSMELLHVILAHLNYSYDPWLMLNFRFRSISWKQIDRF